VAPMKKVAGRLKLELSQYRDLEAFAQFGSDLDADTQRTLARGARLVKTLNQGERAPLPVADQVLHVFAATNGFVTDATRKSWFGTASPAAPMPLSPPIEMPNATLGTPVRASSSPARSSSTESVSRAVAAIVATLLATAASAVRVLPSRRAGTAESSTGRST